MKIAVECYADEKLVELLVYKNGFKPLHMSGKGNIFNYLHKESTVSATGLVDEDPGSTQPRRFRDDYEEVEAAGMLKLFRHKDKKDIRVISLYPRLEEWIISRADASGINLSEYSIPENGEKLHDRFRYDKDPNYTLLINKLVESQDKEIIILKKWLSGDTP
ncbi:MAG TPA: hypothetical protein PK293_18045 [Spirochaetota bacterium]|nr:hypothetical protein [Spirochaetota bacterium]